MKDRALKELRKIRTYLSPKSWMWASGYCTGFAFSFLLDGRIVSGLALVVFAVLYSYFGSATEPEVRT